MKKHLLLLFFTLCILISIGQPRTINLNEEIQPESLKSATSRYDNIPEFKSAQRARPFLLNKAIWQHAGLRNNDTLQLDIFSDKSYKSVIEKITTDINGTTSIRAKLAGFRFAYCHITISDDGVLLHIDIPEQREKYITRMHQATNSIYLLQLDTRNLDYLEGGPPVIPDYKPDNRKKNEPDTLPKKKFNKTENTTIKSEGNEKTGIFETMQNSGLEEQIQIDIMIVYTPEAKLWADINEGGITNTIAAAMATCNLVSENSNLGINFNLVYSGEVAYIESGTSNTDLSRLKNSTDGHMDEVHDLRNQYSADLVVLLTKTDDTGGIANLLTFRYGDDMSAFSLSRVQQTSTTTTMIHEIGHNMGAHHHKLQKTQPGPNFWYDWDENTWSAGWRWYDSVDEQYYCSVMTYTSAGEFDDENPSVEIPYFSDPDILFQGNPSGDIADGNNAQTLREVKQHVSLYRDAARDALTGLYCQAGSINNYEHIVNVEIGSINHTSGYRAYSDFSLISTDVVPGVPYPLTVEILDAFIFDELIVWVDWNDDKDFDDAGEKVYASGAIGSDQYTTVITPPVGTTPGPKRMRIRLHDSEDGANDTPCGNSEWGEVEDYTLNVLPEITWTGALSSDWGTPGNWSGNEVPGSTSNVLISLSINQPIINDNTVCNYLNLAPGTYIIINPGKSLTVEGNLTVPEGESGILIYSDENATGSLIVKGTASGNAEVERYMTGNAWHLATGLAGQAFSEFLIDNNNIPTRNGNERGMMSYNTPDNSWSFFTDGQAGSFETGKGYAIRTLISGTVIFSGEIATGTQSAGISNAGTGWNLTGNPFTSALDINIDPTNSFLEINKAKFDQDYVSIYVWDETYSTTQYRVINLASDPDYASINQGFFIKALDDDNISFTPVMQSHQPSAGLKSGTVRPGFDLVARTGDKMVSTSIKFIDNATPGIDPGYDAGALKLDPAFALSTRLVADNGKDYAIQSLPLNYTDFVIPVTFNHKSGGEVTFSLSSVIMPGGYSISLEDREYNSFTPLLYPENYYKINLAANSPSTGRFFLHLSGLSTTSADEVSEKSIIAYKAGAHIIIEGNVGQNAVASLFDIQGRLLSVNKLQNDLRNSFPVQGLETGIYMLQVTDNGQQYRIKIPVVAQ